MTERRCVAPWELATPTTADAPIVCETDNVSAASGFPAMTRSTGGTTQLVSLPPQYTIASTSGKLNSRADSTRRSLDISETMTDVRTPVFSSRRAVSAISACGTPPPYLVSTAASAFRLHFVRWAAIWVPRSLSSLSRPDIVATVPTKFNSPASWRR